MTHVGIEHNLRRLTLFLHDRDNHGVILEDVASFLHLYGRIMDLHGCGQEQLSHLYLDPEDFEEMRIWAAQQEGYFYNEKPATVTGVKLQMPYRYFRFCRFPYIYHVIEIQNYFS